MSASPVLDAFPRRPIALVTTPQRRRRRIIGLLFCLLLFGPSLYWGMVRWNEASLRADLRERGVMAAWTATGEGSCTARRGRLTGEDTPRGCSFTIIYTLRAEEGGGDRQADVYLHGRPPILTPSAWYDPEDPSRVMLRPEIDRDPSWSQQWAPFLLLLLPLIGLVWWWFSGNRLTIHFRPAGAPRATVKVYGPGEQAFLVRPPADAPADQPWVLALRSPRGRYYALDAGLKDLDLSEQERAALQNAAWA
jgi:hypothetical protein